MSDYLRRARFPCADPADACRPRSLKGAFRGETAPRRRLTARITHDHPARSDRPREARAEVDGGLAASVFRQSTARAFASSGSVIEATILPAAFTSNAAEGSEPSRITGPPLWARVVASAASRARTRHARTHNGRRNMREVYFHARSAC